MTAKEIRNQHDDLIQNIRDFIYSSVSHRGTAIHPEGNECDYYALKCGISLTHNSCGLSSLEMPCVTELRAYIGEGWIYAQIDGIAEPIDIDELYTEDLLDIVENLD